jgi:WXG100 family type VII secretion target
MATIKINFADARKCADNLRGVAEDCAAAGTAAKKNAGGVTQFWGGMAADSFVSRIDRWSAEMTAIERDMNALAKIIRDAANEFEEKEKAAAKAAAAAAAAKSVAAAAANIAAETANATAAKTANATAAKTAQSIIDAAKSLFNKVVK